MAYCYKRTSLCHDLFPLLRNVLQELQHCPAVARLVVVPANELDKVVVQRDPSLGVKRTRGQAPVEVRRHDVILGVLHNAYSSPVSNPFDFRGSPLLKPTLERSLSSSLDGLLNLVVRRPLLQHTREVNDGDVGSRHADRHARELPVQAGDDLADGLGSARAAWDEVLRGAAATPPVLRRGPVDGLLRGGVRVDGGHQALLDAELVVDDLGQRREAVRGAGGVGDDVGAVVRGLVHAHDVHGRVGRGRRDDDLLGARLEVGVRLLEGLEHARGLDDVLGATLLPRDGRGVLLVVELDLLSVDDDAVALVADLAVESAVGRVIFQHVGLVSLIVSYG